MSPAEFHQANLSVTDYERAQDFWSDVILNRDGSVNLENVYAELLDYEKLMKNASQVYSYITCDRMSKTTYYARDVIQQSDRCVDDTVRREIYDVLINIHSLEDLEAYLQDYKPEEVT